ncbi:MAG: BtpA/SgcQ family protein [Acidobacteriota bacterium]
MWTQSDFDRILVRKAVIGMVHLRPLPGAPLFGGSMAAVIDAAAADVEALRLGGADALLFENFGDRPFRPGAVDAVTISTMTVVITALRSELSVPFGVNVLRNDGQSALSIAVATGAAFIRVNVLIGAMVTDQGVIAGEADRILRMRANLGADVAIFADHMVKHAVPLAPVDPAQSARDLRQRGLADVLVASGPRTGSPPEIEHLRALRELTEAPIVLGSGVNEANAASFASSADGAIVGTSVKIGGIVDQPVDSDRVRRVVDRFKSS